MLIRTFRRFTFKGKTAGCVSRLKNCIWFCFGALLQQGMSMYHIPQHHEINKVSSGNNKRLVDTM
jgi:hypothetical protein